MKAELGAQVLLALGLGPCIPWPPGSLGFLPCQELQLPGASLPPQASPARREHMERRLEMHSHSTLVGRDCGASEGAHGSTASNRLGKGADK